MNHRERGCAILLDHDGVTFHHHALMRRSLSPQVRHSERDVWVAHLVRERQTGDLVKCHREFGHNLRLEVQDDTELLGSSAISVQPFL